MGIWDKFKIHNKKKVFFLSVALNVAYFILMMLFFSPSISSDDYAQTNTLYGVCAKDYDYQCIYSSWIYGKIVVFFLRMCPSVAWYTVLFCFWCFLAFVLFTNYILQKSRSINAFLILNIFLLYYSYEAYVCIQFTKCSAIIGAIGAFLLLKETNVFEKILGVFLVVMCSLIRYQNYEMILGGTAILLLMIIVHRVWYDKKIPQKFFWSRMILLLIVFTIGTVILPKVDFDLTDEEIQSWEEYNDFNEGRIAIIDYEVVKYDDNEDFYKKLNVSKNDLYIWSQQNYDRTALTLEIGKAIIGTQKRQAGLMSRALDLENIKDFFKDYPLFFLKIDVFYCLLIITCIALFSQNKTSNVMYGFFSGILMLMAFEYYLFINNRYGLHRVDVGLVCYAIMAQCLFIDFEALQIRECSAKHYNILLGIIVGVLVICTPYKNFVDDLSDDNEGSKPFREFAELANSDETHIYMPINSWSQYRKGVLYKAFEKPPVGLIYNYHLQAYPGMEGVFRDFNVKSPYKEGVDRGDFYWVSDENETNVKEMEEYISEQSGKDCEMYLVRKLCRRNVYICLSKPIDDIYHFFDVHNNSDIIQRTSISEKDDKIIIKGNAYLSDSDHFKENIIIEMTDSETNKKKYYYAVKTYDEKNNDFESNFSLTTKPPTWYDSQDKISIIIEKDGDLYSNNQNINIK